MNFSEALKLIKEGKFLQRDKWNGKNMWVSIYDGKKSLKISLQKDSKTGESHIIYFDVHCSDNSIILPFIVMKTSDNKLVPWLASQTDILAEDWQEVG